MRSAIVIIIFGVAIIALAVWLASFSFRFLSTALHAQGAVIDMEQTEDGLWRPVIEFTTRDGKTMTVRPGSASNPSPYKKGQVLDILYSPNDPSDWRINRFVDMWLLPLIFGSVGAIVAVAGVGFLLVENGFMPALGGKVLLLLGVAVFGISGLLMLWGAWYVQAIRASSCKMLFLLPVRYLSSKRGAARTVKGERPYPIIRP